MMSVDDAVRALRADPAYADMVYDSYLDEDLAGSGERFLASDEFRETCALIEGRHRDGVVIDLGAGTGIASYAFARSGARLVHAVEPDPSDLVGRGAISALCAGLPVEIVDAVGAGIPLPDQSADVIYTRQVLHHIKDLPEALRECARLLKPGGYFFACREHVVDDAEQMRVFLHNHPMHQRAGNEGAHSLPAYQAAIEGAGLQLVRTLGPWESVINAFPIVQTQAELEHFARAALTRKLGPFGDWLGRMPWIERWMWSRIDRPVPGRLYAFLARKP